METRSTQMPTGWITHDSVEAAVDDLIRRYDAAVELACGILNSGETTDGPADYSRYSDVVYPKLVVEVESWRPIDRTEPFGYVDRAGRYAATVSRPRLMRRYLTAQLDRLTTNYPCTISTGPSEVRIPPEYLSLPADCPPPPRVHDDAGVIPRPSLDDVHDGIIDGSWDVFHDSEMPLFHFSPQRFDIACERIEHYTGIGVEGVQKYILFTNYAMHTTEFVRYALSELAIPESRYTELRLNDGRVLRRGEVDGVELQTLLGPSSRQMPRYDLSAEDNTGVTIINIGVGPSNAKTITDCLAVLRPECWIMIGHCAGLDGRMRIGDLILGNAYQRRDHILDDRIGLDIPIPAVPEVQRALEKSVNAVYGDNHSLMRTGTVMSTDDRNWEWHTSRDLWRILRGSTAVAVDMESATLAANGYRYRIPYGTLLSVSDLPLHNVPKLPAGAQAFYSSSKEAHLICAMRAMEKLAAKPEKLHTRKLRRTIGEVPMR
ncbi:AMP nucleosidase [Corynebacterium antarcticum]|nr:AMP nucleosidase [Corynebacterium antarcticum]